MNASSLLGSLFLLCTFGTRAIAQNPRDILPECRANKECADLIAPRKPAALTDSDRLRAAALRTTILFTRAQASSDLAKALETRLDSYCLALENLLNPVPPEIVADVKITFITAVSVDRCPRSPAARAGESTLLADGTRGIYVMVGEQEIEGDKGTVITLGDGVYRSCTFDRQSAGWMPATCKVIAKP